MKPVERASCRCSQPIYRLGHPNFPGKRVKLERMLTGHTDETDSHGYREKGMQLKGESGDLHKS